MARNPEDIARAGVEKAIKALDKASEKYEAAQVKAYEAYEAQHRAARELKWTASHPDLPEDFNLDEFRRSLEAPFEEESDLTQVVAGEQYDPEGEAVREPEPEEEPATGSKPEIDVPAAIAQGEDEGNDDPWAGEE